MQNRARDVGGLTGLGTASSTAPTASTATTKPFSGCGCKLGEDTTDTAHQSQSDEEGVYFGTPLRLILKSPDFPAHYVIECHTGDTVLMVKNRLMSTKMSGDSEEDVMLGSSFVEMFTKDGVQMNDFSLLREYFHNTQWAEATVKFEKDTAKMSHLALNLLAGGVMRAVLKEGQLADGKHLNQEADDTKGCLTIKCNDMKFYFYYTEKNTIKDVLDILADEYGLHAVPSVEHSG